jgi:pilus assembly protein TadC
MNWEFLRQLALIDSEFFSEKTRKRIGRNLVQAGIPLEAGEYLSFSLTAGLISAAFAALLAYYFTEGALESVAVFFASLAVMFLALTQYPSYRKKRRAQEIEAELSVALRAMRVELDSTSFERVLRNAAGGYGELGKEFLKVVKEIEGGESVSNSLNNFSQRVDSLLARRAVTQLAFTYEHGGGSEGLKKLSDELASVQKARGKEYAAKLSFLGLVFIAVSTIVPALFSAYVVVGSAFMEAVFTKEQVLAAFLVVFPLLDAAVLFYLRQANPVSGW